MYSSPTFVIDGFIFVILNFLKKRISSVLVKEENQFWCNFFKLCATTAVPAALATYWKLERETILFISISMHCISFKPFW